MDANLTAYSTETLQELLAAKLKKPSTPMLEQIIDAIRNELKDRVAK
jgi:hypothetical protein